MARAKNKTKIVPSSGNVFADLGLPNAEEKQTKVRLAVAIKISASVSSRSRSGRAGPRNTAGRADSSSAGSGQSRGTDGFGLAG